MKRVLKWIEEEKIAIMVLLVAIGLILNTPPTKFMWSGFLIYAAILIGVFHLGHRLYLKYKK